MSKIPIRHHYVPRFLLNKFTIENRIYCIDKDEKRIFNLSTKDTAVIKNYYSIDIDGLPKYYFEELFSKIEYDASLVIKRILETSQMPENEDDISNLFLFIALLSARVPNVRDSLQNGLEDIVRMTGIQTIHRKYDEISKKVRAENEKIPEISKEELISIFSDKNVTQVEIFNSMTMSLMIPMIEAIYKSLYLRKFFIAYVSSNKSNLLVTCDNPVLLYWNKKMHPNYQPGFGISNTVMAIALSPNILLCSQFEDVPESPVSMKNWHIREHNYLSTLISRRYIYSNSETYNLWTEHGVKMTINDYLSI